MENSSASTGPWLYDISYPPWSSRYGLPFPLHFSTRFKRILIIYLRVSCTMSMSLVSPYYYMLLQTMRHRPRLRARHP
eukprot:scaffold222078_cov56-Cyclotella_meneghiniana.AAC.1